jgi:hypothetical protein
MTDSTGVTGVTAEQQEKIIAEWVARHTAGS